MFVYLIALTRPAGPGAPGDRDESTEEKLAAEGQSQESVVWPCHPKIYIYDQVAHDQLLIIAVALILRLPTTITKRDQELLVFDPVALNS